MAGKRHGAGVWAAPRFWQTLLVAAACRSGSGSSVSMILGPLPQVLHLQACSTATPVPALQERLWKQTAALAVAFEVAKLKGRFGLRPPPEGQRTYHDEIVGLRTAVAKEAAERTGGRRSGAACVATCSSLLHWLFTAAAWSAGGSRRCCMRRVPILPLWLRLEFGSMLHRPCIPATLYSSLPRLPAPPACLPAPAAIKAAADSNGAAVAALKLDPAEDPVFRDLSFDIQAAGSGSRDAAAAAADGDLALPPGSSPGTPPSE